MGRRTQDYEGWKGEIYLDTEGNPTIGYGHKLTPEEIEFGTYANGITREASDYLYAKDKKVHTDSFYKNNPRLRTAPESVRSALEDQAYNMGSGYLDKFPNARKALLAGDYTTAANEFRNSKYAKQVGQRAFDNAALIDGSVVNPNEAVGGPTVKAPVKVEDKLVAPLLNDVGSLSISKVEPVVGQPGLVKRKSDKAVKFVSGSGNGIQGLGSLTGGVPPTWQAVDGQNGRMF